MTIYRVPVAFTLVVALVAPAGPLVSIAQAQGGPVLPVTIGQTVWVTSLDGVEVKGVISGITATTIDLRGEAGTKHLNVSEIRRVATRDSLQNGFWIGAAVALVPGVVYIALGELPDRGQSEPAQVVATVAAVTLLYGGIGALIDRAIEGRRTIYERSGTAAAIQIGPIVTRRGVGLGGTIRW